MSRLGKLPIKLATGVQVVINDQELLFTGPQGKFTLKLHPAVQVKLENDELIVSPRHPGEQQASAFWGLMWSLIKNSVEGVSQGFTKKLEVNGVGYRAVVNGQKLNMNLGFSHPIEFDIPQGITISVEGNIISVFGIDKAQVGEAAAQIRRFRPPEPYKGKGVKYVDEVIRRKAGKAAAKAAA